MARVAQWRLQLDAHGLITRRNLKSPYERAHYVTSGPSESKTLQTRAHAAVWRWNIEMGLRSPRKLDEYEVSF